MFLHSVLFALVITLLTGCCFHGHKSYRFEERTTRNSNTENVISLRITIDQTYRFRKTPYLYHSHIYTYPYSIYIKASRRESLKQPMVIHSVRLSSGNEVIYENRDSIICEFLIDKQGGFSMDSGNGKRRYNYAAKFRHDLGESLKYERGKEVLLEVIWEIPGLVERQVHSARYKAGSGGMMGSLIIHSMMD